jgi:hypothetical protein
MGRRTAGGRAVCLDLGGPALQVTKEDRVRVAAISPAQVTNRLAEGTALLARETTLRVCVGQAARQRVQGHYRWDEKGALMAALYEEASANK